MIFSKTSLSRIVTLILLVVCLGLGFMPHSVHAAEVVVANVTSNISFIQYQNLVESYTAQIVNDNGNVSLKVTLNYIGYYDYLGADFEGFGSTGMTGVYLNGVRTSRTVNTFFGGRTSVHRFPLNNSDKNLSITKLYNGVNGEDYWRQTVNYFAPCPVRFSISSPILIDPAYFNITPSISLNSPTQSQTINNSGTVSISGTVTDPDASQTLTISATVAGVNKQTTVSTPAASRAWSLSWSGGELAQNIYSSDVTVTVNDGVGGTATALYTGDIIVDKTAPGQPSIIANTNWTNAASVPVTINGGTDTVSGVARTEYSLSGATVQGWTTYSSELSITNAGQTTISARTIDNAGNVSSIASAIVKIDRTKPTNSVVPNKQETWVTSPIVINVSVSDDAAGVQIRQYELTQSSTPTGVWAIAGANTYNVTVNSEGEWYLHLNTIDQAGNQQQNTYGPYRFFALTLPTGIAAVNPTSSTLDITWTQVAGHEYQVQIINDSGTVIATSEWGAAAPYIVTDLQPNTRYIPEVKARKQGIESEFIQGTAQYTDAKPVRIATFQAMDNAIRITLDTASTGNPAGTKYLIKNITINDTSPEIEQEWTNTGLLNDMSYPYLAKVVNRNGKEGEWFLIGTGYTAATEIIVPGNWDDPLGGLTPIQLPNEFDPETIEGKAVTCNGTPAIVVKGRSITVSMNNVQNAKKYAVSLDGYGFSVWKDLDGSGGFTETMAVNQPGLYKFHVKFQNAYGGESPAYVRHFLLDWVQPEVTTAQKIKGQTATTTGSFTVIGSGADNLSSVLYDTGSGWQWFTPGADVTLSGIALDNTRRAITFRFSDLNGNATTKEYKIWAINK